MLEAIERSRAYFGNIGEFRPEQVQFLNFTYLYNGVMATHMR